MSRYDGMPTEQLELAVMAMSQIAKGYESDHWQQGQDEMHDEINQVLIELDDRRKN